MYFFNMRRKTDNENIMFSFTINEEPIAWKRPARNPRTNTVFDPQKLEKEQLRWRIRDQFRNEPFTQPIKLLIKFWMPIPKSAKGALRRDMVNGTVHHIKKPDIDNLQKFILDVMTGVIYVDDCQIYSVTVDKVYNDNPGTYVEIIPVTHNLPRQEKLERLYENDTGDS